MGKDSGGGQQQPTQQTVTQTNIPEYAAPYFTSLLDRAQTASQTPYQQYDQQRLQPLSGNQQTAIQMAGDTSMPGQVGQATNLLGQAGQQALQASNFGLPSINSSYQPGQINSQQVNSQQVNAQQVNPNGQVQHQNFDNNAAQQYMSPYIQSALNPALQELQRQGDITGRNLAADSTQKGALGGYRDQLRMAENQRNIDQQKGNLLAQGYQSAFQNAQQQFGADRSSMQGAQNANIGFGMQAGLANQQTGLQAGLANQQSGLQAQMANQQSGLQAQQLREQAGQAAGAQNLQAQQSNATNRLGLGQLGVQGAQVASQAGQNLGQMGALTNDIQNRQLQNLQTTGALEQQQGQQALDLAYSNFQNQVNHPNQQIGFMSNILRGNMGPMTQDVTQYQAPPNPYTQLAGLGIGALGASKLFGST